MRPVVSEGTVLRTLGLGLLLAWVAMVGRDLSWDVINHHLYLPYSLLTGRYRTDLFAAGPQAYQNPVGYLLFYGLAQPAVPSWIAGLVLTLLHGLCVWPLYRLCSLLWGTGPDGRWWRVLGLALALATPAFLLVVGTSSIDPISALLVLTALALVTREVPGARVSTLAGICLGIAVAIKPVNAPFTLGVAALCTLRCAAGQLRWRDFGLLIVGAVVAALLLAGPWAYWLWVTFGNPIFPLFNDRFLSPFAAPQAVVATRFVPGSWVDYLTRPWDMMALRSFASTEALTPDLRPMVLVVLGALATVWVAARRQLRWRDCIASPACWLAVFALVSYVFWMRSSGNARYAIPLLMVVGLLVVSAGKALLGASAARVVLALLLTLQTAYFAADGEHRNWATDWTRGPYIEVQMAPRLTREPFLHLSVGVQSMAALAPSMHPQGAFVNLIGQVSLPTEGPLGDALRHRLDAWRGRTRVLISGTLQAGHVGVPQKVRDYGDILLYRYGLRFDFTDCEPVRIVRHARDSMPDFSMISCATIERPLDDPNFAVEERLANRIFELVERRCPAVFAPVPLVSDYDGEKWQRRYVNTDARLTVSIKEGVKIDHFRSIPIAQLGSIEDWQAGRGRDPCAAWRQEMFK